ncbi:TlpA family protein disulfide reductase [Modestobacter muralis]|uniref:TlpA family protein disulfide reductase n=1 Tax=Modestobacter muralis TaxID=1608614 RepID=A0A6P0H6W6_9ACTN|nr:TlpA disulfide reductase family protein [Modestobacter muralis]NEN51075.1 TlpA family protein disulfide reductase [Modestobacter muralis]
MTSPRVTGALLRRTTATLVTVLALTGCSSGARPSADDAGQAPVDVPRDVATCESFAAADGQRARNGDTLPALSLPCLVPGEDVALDDLGDRPVLVNLWASWCGPCREEMPLLQAAYERSRDRIGVLGVDTEDTPSAAASLLADLDLTYAHVVDREKELLTELGAPGLPVTLAVAADGTILDRQIGQASADRLDELVSLLLADAASTPP